MPCAARDLEYNRVVTSAEYKRRLLRVLGGEANLRYLEKNSGWTYNFTDPAYAAFPYTLFSSTQCQVRPRVQREGSKRHRREPAAV